MERSVAGLSDPVTVSGERGSGSHCAAGHEKALPCVSIREPGNLPENVVKPPRKAAATLPRALAPRFVGLSASSGAGIFRSEGSSFL